VPCPVDAAHTVYEYDLAKHVLVCNRVKDAAAMARLPYYSENINSGSHGKAEGTASTSAKSAADSGDDGAAHTAPTAQQQQGLVDKLVRRLARL
jgi:hypothetical protein